MSLATNLQNLATRTATESKSLRVLINGNAADLNALTTTAKNNLVAAINEVKTLAESAGAGVTDLDDLTDVQIVSVTTGQILRYDGANFVNVAGDTYFQPRDSDLDALAALTTTTYGRALLELVNQAGLMALVQSASETASGKVELATQAETNAGTDDARAITPLKFQTRLAAYAQPVDPDLTAIAALTTTTYGRAFLALASQVELMGLLSAATATAQGIVELATNVETTTGTDTTRAVTPAGVKAVADLKQSVSEKGAANGYASLDGGGKIPASQLPATVMEYKGVWNASTNSPALADGTGDTGDWYRVGTAGARNLGSGSITFDVGDYVIYNGTTWEKSDTTDSVVSVAGKTGVVTLAAADILSGVFAAARLPAATEAAQGAVELATTTEATTGTDTTRAVHPAGLKAVADTKQPLDATLTALAGVSTVADRLIYATGVDTFGVTTLTAFARTLLDDVDAAAARTTLDVYSKTEIGNPETDLVAVFEAGLV